MNEPVVSVVTPFRNTSQYLPECIQSVLSQTYESFEYILVDNCSTDGSSEVAEAYARRDSRIRLFRQPLVVTQVQNYNSSLSKISKASRYCKIVQADDYIFPECLQLMVQAFEQSASIGLVAACDLKGTSVRGSEFPPNAGCISGRETCRLYLRDGIHVFGSPTTVMYRSSLVRENESFYNEKLLHEDTEKCFEILEHWDFGFVYQVLSFLRTDNESISSAVRLFQPDVLDWYILVRRYASLFFDAAEAEALTKSARREYYGMLARQFLRRRKPAFWQYHADGLKTLDEQVDKCYLASQVGREILRLVSHPSKTISSVSRRLRVNDRHRGQSE